MDPVSAVGIAAASAQFAGVAGKRVLRGIGLLKGLKGTPTRLSALLSDIDKSITRIHHLQGLLDDDQSNLTRLLSPEQVATLRGAVGDAHNATTELQLVLDPLFGPQNNIGTGLRGSAKRLWRDVISVKVEKEIEENIDKVRRMNDEVLRELQLGGLDLETSIL